MSKVNYYRVLGIEPNANEEELQKAFKSLFDRYNPENNPNSLFLKTMFEQLNEAYTVLGDREKRVRYNLANGYVAPPQEQLPPPVETASRGVSRENESNKAYVFLFIVIALLIGGGGYIAFRVLGKDVDVVNPEQDIVVSEEIENNEKKVESVVKVKDAVTVESNSTESEQKSVAPKLEVKTKEVAPIADPKRSVVTADHPNKERAVPKTEKQTEGAVKTNDLKDEFGTKRSFKIGASKNDVWAVKGDPSDIKNQGDLEIWYYGKSKIKFRNGKVVE